MKIAVNRCYGGFGLSAKAVKRIAELNGKECYFYTGGFHSDYVRVDEPKGLMWTAFDCPVPENSYDDDFYHDHYLTSYPEDRTDPKLIQVIEELGSESDGDCAHLHIIEIPDDVEYEIDEYDGIETIHEKHRSW